MSVQTQTQSVGPALRSTHEARLHGVALQQSSVSKDAEISADRFLVDAG
ncbi:MAG TPA: hypothetical protein VF443_07485 [Nitrospira sp.]